MHCSFFFCSSLVYLTQIRTFLTQEKHNLDTLVLPRPHRGALEPIHSFPAGDRALTKQIVELRDGERDNYWQFGAPSVVISSCFQIRRFCFVVDEHTGGRTHWERNNLPQVYMQLRNGESSLGLWLLPLELVTRPSPQNQRCPNHYTRI